MNRPDLLRTPSIRADGFTILELIFVIFIIAIASGLAIPSLYTLSGAKIQSQTRRLGEIIRYTYNQAIMRNRIYQLLFDIDENTYQVMFFEPAPPVDLAAGDGGNVEDAKDDDTSAREEEKPEDEAVLVDFDGEFHPDDQLGAPVRLSRDIRFRGIYTFHKRAETTEGKVFILFFPNGFIEKSRIYIEDTYEHQYTIKINQLNGRISMINDYEPIEGS